VRASTIYPCAPTLLRGVSVVSSNSQDAEGYRHHGSFLIVPASRNENAAGWFSAHTASIQRIEALILVPSPLVYKSTCIYLRRFCSPVCKFATSAAPSLLGIYMHRRVATQGPRLSAKRLGVRMTQIFRFLLSEAMLSRKFFPPHLPMCSTLTTLTYDGGRGGAQLFSHATADFRGYRCLFSTERSPSADFIFRHVCFRTPPLISEDTGVCFRRSAHQALTFVFWHVCFHTPPLISKGKVDYDPQSRFVEEEVKSETETNIFCLGDSKSERKGLCVCAGGSAVPADFGALRRGWTERGDGRTRTQGLPRVWARKETRSNPNGAKLKEQRSREGE
jgi:hypothetical protein